MDETSDILFIPVDERNARPASDHRTRQPFATAVAVPPQTRHVVVQTGGREPVVVREASPVRTVMPYPAPERRLLGNLTASEAVEVASQLLAALVPLPIAPVATGRVETDVENLTLYHSALAVHAKRDEQLRTVGSLLAKLLS